MTALLMPVSGPGRRSATQSAAFETGLKSWCSGILEIQSRMDFKASSRGWCYLLEEHGLSKSEFNRAQKLINDCRKSGLLPLDLCAEDDGRSADGLEELD